MDLSQFNDQDDDQPIENKDMKIKLLDDLIEKIMSLPDEAGKAPGADPSVQGGPDTNEDPSRGMKI